MPDQELIDSVKDFATREVAPAAAAIDRSREFPAEHWHKLGEFGLTGLSLPTAYDGLGADLDTLLAAIGAVAGADASTAWMLLSHTAVATGIERLGTDAQKQRYLPALARAKRIGGTTAGTETGGGSNPNSMKSFARQEGDHYVLDGGKFFITQAGAADVYLVVARTDDGPAPKCLSCFIVEKEDAGLRFGKRETLMGLHGVHVAEIFFDHVTLPADRLLGKLGGAGAMLGAISGITTLGSSAAALGVARAAVEVTLAYLKQRKVTGHALATVPGVQAQVGAILMELEGADAWLQHGLAVHAAKRGPLPLWMTKISVTEAAGRIVDACLGLHGAIGYSQALPLERCYRDLRAFRIHWGNNDVLRDRIGRTALA